LECSAARQGFLALSGKVKLRFELVDALDRANGLALGAIVVADTFHAGVRVDHVGRTLGDGFGRALSDAGAAFDAFISNLHCHGKFLLVNMVYFDCIAKITTSLPACQLTKITNNADE
jgi:hypothetical protein